MTSSSNANMERSGSVETVRSSASLVFGSADSGALPRFLLQQRLGSADLEQVRFGPVLGRGSFGTVYKGGKGSCPNSCPAAEAPVYLRLAWYWGYSRF